MMEAKANLNSASSRRRTLGLFGLPAVSNLAAWMWAVSPFPRSMSIQPCSAWRRSLGSLVFVTRWTPTIPAAIDNVVRKLIQDGRRAQSVGFWFSLGHSTVVILACFVIALSAVATQGWLGVARQIGSVRGP
jgi:high-affinity nickel-transport protein